MKTVLTIALVVLASYVMLGFAIDIASMPFQQITELLNAASASTNF